MSNKIKNKQLEIISEFDINNNRLINVATPVIGTDAVNKDYLSISALNAALQTGLYVGGLLNISGDTGFSVSGGTGYLVDPLTKIITTVYWDDFPYTPVMNFGPTDITISIGIKLDDYGIPYIYQQIPKFTPIQRHEIIVLGEIFIHPTTRLVTNALFMPILSRDLSSIVDIHINEGPVSIAGNSVSANGVNTYLNVTDGKFVGYSINSKKDLAFPNESSVLSINHIHFFTVVYYNNGSVAEWRYGGDPVTYDNIDSAHWSDGVNWVDGVFTLRESTPSKYNLRILARCAITGQVHFLIYPTQSIQFQNIVDAESALNALGVNVPDEILTFATPLCYIILRGDATNLSDPTQCKIIPIHSISATAGSVATAASNVSYTGTGAINMNGVSNVEEALTYINNKIESIDYVINNLNLNAISGTTIHLATSTPISHNPKTIVIVEVNGIPVNLGDGVKNTDCFFSHDGAVTARTISNIQQGDYLYWNEDTSTYPLDSDDKISFIYMYF